MTQFNNIPDYPAPDPEAVVQSHKLVERVTSRINEGGGTLRFDEFMSLLLYSPGLGYYSAGSRKFGRDGDFVTAPEISPLFSRCLANQIKQVFEQLEQPHILELGAGSGVMACDILTELDKQDALPEAYWILEVSADLKQRQQDLLKERVPFFYDRIQWFSEITDTRFNGVIVGNEVIDALPVRRFKKTSDGFTELGVGIEADSFNWVEINTDEILAEQLATLEQSLGFELPVGYVSEMNVELGHWLSAVTAQLDKGLVLFLDYGYPRKEYYHPDRSDGTLLCHYRHRAHANPFFYPGLQDITASVDFTLLAECAMQADLNVCGYTNQAWFLLANGLEQFMAELPVNDSRQQTVTAQQVRALTLPGEMGERIKAMGLARGLSLPLAGFSLNDQRVKL